MDICHSQQDLLYLQEQYYMRTESVQIINPSTIIIAYLLVREREREISPCVSVCVCVCVCVSVFCVEENQERSAGIEWRLYMVPALAFEYLSPYLFL